MSIEHERVKKESAPARLDSHIQAILHRRVGTAVNVNRKRVKKESAPARLDSHIQAIRYTEG